MTRTIRLLALAALLAAPALDAQARPARHPARSAAIPAQPNPAVKARAAVMDRFSARMGRLDALMGPAGRSRSASAEH